MSATETSAASLSDAASSRVSSSSVSASISFATSTAQHGHSQNPQPSQETECGITEYFANAHLANAVAFQAAALRKSAASIGATLEPIVEHISLGGPRASPRPANNRTHVPRSWGHPLQRRLTDVNSNAVGVRCAVATPLMSHWNTSSGKAAIPTPGDMARSRPCKASSAKDLACLVSLNVARARSGAEAAGRLMKGPNWRSQCSRLPWCCRQCSRDPRLQTYIF